ncbi:MAG: response regulator transcription factor [Bacteroidia bacterium]|nr:response regulator transcription factor [Bacteroidia bacterium]
MIKAIAIDDEPLALELIQEFCSQTNIISLEKTFTKVSELQKYIQNIPIDLLFLDIQMPMLSGVELYKSLQQNVMVIFTTAHSQYAIDGFDLNAVDYLLKPFSYERFLTAVNKANELYDYKINKINSEIQYLHVRSDYSLHKIPTADILFIESFADYIDIHITDSKKITTRMTLKTVMEKLPKNDFMRVHRSFVIPLKRIEKIGRKTIYLSQREIPIGVNYEKEFFTRFNTQ